MHILLLFNLMSAVHAMQPPHHDDDVGVALHCSSSLF